MWHITIYTINRIVYLLCNTRVKILGLPKTPYWQLGAATIIEIIPLGSGCTVDNLKCVCQLVFWMMTKIDWFVWICVAFIYHVKYQILMFTLRSKCLIGCLMMLLICWLVVILWWLHASENPIGGMLTKNPSSMLCVVSGLICTFLYQNLFSDIVYSIKWNKILTYHNAVYLLFFI